MAMLVDEYINIQNFKIIALNVNSLVSNQKRAELQIT